MSHFAKELEALLADKKGKIKSAAELGRLAKIDQATLSRIRYGNQKISWEDLDRVAMAVDPSPMTHAKLLRSRLMDELRPPGGDLIEIELTGARPAILKEDAPPAYLTKLPPVFEKALATIAQRLQNPGEKELKAIVRGLASLYERGSL